LSTVERLLPPGFEQGPVQGSNIIGEVTESLHRWLLDGWTEDRPPPRLEENLSFVPKDREEVIYVYMYRAARNTALLNSKQWRASVLSPRADEPSVTPDADVYYERAPLYLNLFYLIAVHSRFRSDAERLLGWVMMRLAEGTHLIYRPRRYVLPDGRVVDSNGTEWSADPVADDVIMEKVSLAMVDDLTVGDAINFMTIHEAPYRPFLTYRAACSMTGRMLSGPPTTIRTLPAEHRSPEPPASQRPGGRIAGGRTDAQNERATWTSPGPHGTAPRPIEDNDSEV